jgi:hypothetical protein
MQFQSIYDMGFTKDQLSRFKNSREKICTNRAVFSVGGTELKSQQCHANLGYHLYDKGNNVFVVNDFEPCFSEARKGLKEFLLECHLADDSPWKELFPHLKLFECGSNLYYFFKLDNCPDRLKGLLLNFSIACRSLSEGDSSKWKCDKESHKFGFEHYKFLMKTFGLNWRQAAVLSRVVVDEKNVRTNAYGTFLWNKQVNSLLNHHFLNNIFSDQFLKGEPKQTNGFSPRGNDDAIWGADHYLEEFGVGGLNITPVKYLFGKFYATPANPKWTVENLVMIVKGEWDKKDDGTERIAA